MNRLKVMISSLCNTSITLADGPASLTTIRNKIKSKLLKAKLFDRKIFDKCWICEELEGTDGYTIEAIKAEVDSADILLVLYLGDAGNPMQNEELPPCHFELKRAMDTFPDKVKLIKFPLKDKSAQTDYDKKFIQYVDSIKKIREKVETSMNLDQVVMLCCAATFEKVIQLSKNGLKIKGKYLRGADALNWANLSFEERKNEIINGLRKHFGSDDENNHHVDYQLGEKTIRMNLSALPGNFSEPAARGLLGQPFLFDSRNLSDDAIIGLIHIVGCYENISEIQAIKLIGINDIVLIPDSFGVFIAEKFFNTQIVLLQNCKDIASLCYRLDRFKQWLTTSPERERILMRAEKRIKIIRAIENI